MLTVADTISHKVTNAHLSYISMQVSPQRLHVWGDAGRSVVRPAHVISFCHPPEGHAGVGGGGQLVTVIREVTPGPVKMD